VLNWRPLSLFCENSVNENKDCHNKVIFKKNFILNFNKICEQQQQPLSYGHYTVNVRYPAPPVKNWGILHAILVPACPC